MSADRRSGHAEHAGVRIYYEAEGSGPPLLLHHGFTGSVETDWRAYGYFEALRDQFFVIALDSRGHGRSDKPHDTASYTMELRTGVASMRLRAGMRRRSPG